MQRGRNNDVINHGLRPADIDQGRDQIYNVGNGNFVFAEPTFLTVPEPYLQQIKQQTGHNSNTFDIIRIVRTPAGFPYGGNRKMYILEHDLACIAMANGFAWIRMTHQQLEDLNI